MLNKNRELIQSIFGIFIGATVGLVMALSYWGTNWYQLALSILAGSLIGYIFVAPRQAWKQIKLAGKQASKLPGVLNLIKEGIRILREIWVKEDFFNRRLFLMSFWGVGAIFSAFLYGPIGIEYPSFLFILIISLCLALTYFLEILFWDTVLDGNHSGQKRKMEYKFFNFIFNKYIIRDSNQAEKLEAGGYEVAGIGNRTDMFIVLNKGSFYDYDWRFAIYFLYALAKLILMGIFWSVLAATSAVWLCVAFPFWLLLVFSGQTLYLKIFTGTAVSVMAGAFYHSYLVGFGTAAGFSLVLIVASLLNWQLFDLLAPFKDNRPLKLAFAKANLFKTKKEVN